jgi:site-specific DNA-methyltransferase (adenine-specific)
MITFINSKCETVLRQFEDNSFFLAIADPPYFDAAARLGYYGYRRSVIGVNRNNYKLNHWELPNADVFDQIKRVSENQIVWGENYFGPLIDTPGRIVWDKCAYNSSFSDAEIASCSVHNKTVLFRYMWNGMMQGKSITEGHIMRGNKKKNQKRIHPTEKPIDLYKWLHLKYNPDKKPCIDPYGGGMSHAIACIELGIPLVIIESDPAMFELALRRIKTMYRQMEIHFE